MSITYPIEFIAKSANSQRLTLSNRQSITESNIGYQTTVVHTDAQWKLQWSWPRMTHSQAESVNAWVLSLNGQVGTFRYYPRQAYRSVTTGITLALAAFAYVDAISVGGYAANTATGLRAGQFIQIGTQLLCITDAGAGADASGHVTISFKPQLRLAYANGTSVNLTNPCGIFRLNASEDIGFGLDIDHRPEFSTMTAREDTNA